jgi:Leucine-rich repeat (LRR) protein
MKQISTLLFFFFIVKISIAQCNIDDYNALRALYISTNGENWKDNSNWDVTSISPKPNCNLSKFKGVFLDGQGRVNLISLGQNNLTGKLTNEIKGLKNLQTLWLNQNSISGVIPSEFGELVNLQRLALSYNQFGGDLPNQIYSLTNMKELSIEFNKFTGSISSNIKNFGFTGFRVKPCIIL